jgi:hypothetical protein
MNCTSADGTSIAITRGRRVCQCDRAFEITVPPKGRSVLTGGCGYAAVRSVPWHILSCCHRGLGPGDRRILGDFPSGVRWTGT